MPQDKQFRELFVRNKWDIIILTWKVIFLQKKATNIRFRDDNTF